MDEVELRKTLGLSLKEPSHDQKKAVVERYKSETGHEVTWTFLGPFCLTCRRSVPGTRFLDAPADKMRGLGRP